MQPRKLILTNQQSPGDIVVLTAAVRDLHRQHPGKFRTAVRTTAMELWENNPAVEGRGSKVEGDAGWEEVECHYPLIHKSNQGALHFIHGFYHYLSERLGVQIEPEAFKGDIHLSREERAMPSQVAGIVGAEVPYWIVVSGGKQDFTAKWWDPARMQAVVDHFRGRILFVQVGEAGHHHPALRGVVDLRGKTSLRELVRLLHHAAGVVCPVTLAMHLAAAVETRKGMPKLRPCVVIAGGREPAHWEAYPGHQFIHTIGALPCCATGGCWKSRVVPLGDGNENDRLLCLNVQRVDSTTGQSIMEPGLHGSHFVHRAGTHPLPHCMGMITADEVIRRVESYFVGGNACYLTPEDAKTCAQQVPELNWNEVTRPSGGERSETARESRLGSSVRQAVGAEDEGQFLTMLVAVNGTGFEQTKRCIESIRRQCSRNHYKLFVGSYATEARTRAYLRRLRSNGVIDFWKDSRGKVDSFAVYESLAAHAKSEWVSCLSTDSRVVTKNPIPEWLKLANASKCPAIKLGGSTVTGGVFVARRASLPGSLEQGGNGMEIAGGRPPEDEEAKHHELLEVVAATQFVFPKERFRGRGIVICGGGSKYFPCVWVCTKMLRHVGCNLAIEVWHLGPDEMTPIMRSLLESLGVRCIDAFDCRKRHPVRTLKGWELKCYAIIHSSFSEVLLLDADNMPLRDPSYLFNANEYLDSGAIFWPDRGRSKKSSIMWKITGVPYRDEPEFESGQMLIHKRKNWSALQIAMHINEYSDFFYRHLHGDKDTFRFAWHIAKRRFAMASERCEDVGRALYQSDLNGERLFQHRSNDKWSLTRSMLRLPDFREEGTCLRFLNELKEKVSPDGTALPQQRDSRALNTARSTRASAASPAVTDVVVFRGPVNAYTGYGLHSLQIVTDLRQAGYSVAIRPTELSERFTPLPQEFRELVVQTVQPQEWELFLHPPDAPPTIGKRSIFFTMWEASRLPAKFVQCLNSAEVVVVPCEWNATCFSASGVDRPIHIVPLGIKTDVFAFREIAMDGPCVFGAAGKMLGGGQRKGLNEIISLFKAAFPNERDVRLRIKAFPDCGVRQDSDPRIEIAASYWSEEQLASWYASLTCFVSLSRSEGWGLMPHQAMGVGRPCIALTFGGHGEFMNEHVGYPLRYRLVPAAYNYSGGGVWAEAEDADVIVKMRQVYNDRTRAGNLGKKASEVAHRYSWTNSNFQLMSIMKDAGMIRAT